MKKYISISLLLFSQIVLAQVYRGFLPPRMTTVQRDAISAPAEGLTLYNTTLKCLQYWNAAVWKGNCNILKLDCSGVVHNGTIQAGVATPAGVTSVISYSGGNGSSYNGQTIASTGVTGLTATLSAGNFANGNGILTFTITGTPSGSGNANFIIAVGGQTCSFTRNVISGDVPPNPDTGVNCAGWLVTYVGTGTATGLVKDKSVTATLTFSNIGVSGNAQTSNSGCLPLPPVTPVGTGFGSANNTTGTMTLKFNREVANIKVYGYRVGISGGSGHGQKQTASIRFKKNGTYVTGMSNSNLSFCTPSNFSYVKLTNTANGYTLENQFGVESGDIAVLSTGKWFDEIEYNITPGYGAILFCIGDAK
ncbi:hypothetical protein [Chryseobacterium sp. MMS23-Vi53]|uniref:hypothetical protein n=1 Tax=Chryseobacterium sp. MMS23-Vi53 TaxID=3386644 RepID=UPI0039EA3D90